MHNKVEDANSRNYMIGLGRQSASWSKTKEDLFIFGLYIFGKKLNMVKIFVKTKKMGDILSHYYGKFYKTIILLEMGRI